MASSVGWNGGPILLYHIYCMIISSKMGTTCRRARQRLGRVGRERNLTFRAAGRAGSGIARENAGHAAVWRGNSKTSREGHRDRFGAARRLFDVVAEATTYKD